MGDRSCQCLPDSSIWMRLLKSNWFCWSRDSKTNLWPSPLQKLSIPPKYTKPLTCSTFSVEQDPKIVRFCIQHFLNGHPGMAKVKCALFWHCSSKPAPFQRGQPDQRSYFQTSHKVYVSPPSLAAVCPVCDPNSFYCLPSHLFPKQYNVLNKDMSGERSTQNNIIRQVTGSLVAGCQSDNDLQAVSQHVGEHMRP